MPPKRKRAVKPPEPGTPSKKAPSADIPLVNIEKTQTYTCRNRDYQIVLIPAGYPQLFFGWCGVVCFDGNLRIDGYDVEATGFNGDPNSMLSVCAPVCNGRPAIFESRGFETLYAKEKRLRLRLKEVTNEYDTIVDKWKDRIACVLLVHRRAPVVVEIFKQLHEHKLYFRLNQCNSTGLDMVNNCGWQLYRLPSQKVIDQALLDMERKRGEGAKLSILAYGHKGSGKSTFVRYLANRLLSSELPIYILDVDLGQTEYTPAGCMSLWKVTKPLLDEPWCHQQINFESTYFYGDVSPANDMSKYKNIFTHLLNQYKEKSKPGSVLLINSMGWVAGSGLTALQYIVDWASPNYCFQIVGKEKVADLTLPQTTELHQIKRDFPLNGRVKAFSKCRPQPLKPPLLRELATIGYFSKMLTTPLFATLQQGRKYKIDFRDATFGIPEDLATVDDHYFLASLNVQLVALCSSDELVSARRILNRDYLPKMFPIDMTTPLLKCHGFGVINSVDMNQKCFSIISPLSPESMSKVTIIARGNRMFVPHVMCKTANGAPTMYVAGAGEILRGVDPDLYGSLRLNRQEKFRRTHFPMQD